jgi:CheY-like chemotaxis protein
MMSATAGTRIGHAGHRLPSPVARRILIADESPVNCLVARQQLRDLGYEAELSATAAQAIELHRRQPFDLILMDSQMALAEGDRITARLRALDRLRRAALVACTTASSEEQRNACLDAGMDDVCVKPLHQIQLRTLLLVWLPPRTVAEAIRRDAATRDELQSLADLFGNGFGEVVAMFAGDTESRLQALHDAASAGDAQQLHRLAHALGGSCASMGGWRMAGLCRLLDLTWQNCQGAGCTRLMNDIASEYSGFRLQLDHVLRMQRATNSHEQTAASRY